jgi:hypothetical protein
MRRRRPVAGGRRWTGGGGAGGRGRAGGPEADRAADGPGMREPHARPGPGDDTGPVTDATAAPVGTGWVARPLAARTPGGRWGLEHRPTGRWVAVGSEARCRTLAAHLTEADAILARPPPA